jgi:hypothetical protein
MKEPSPTTGIDDDLAQVIRGRGPCTYLLLALIALILLYPYLQDGTFGRVSLSILFSLVLLGGAFAIRQSRRGLIFKSGLALLCIALQWTALLSQDTAVLAAAAIFYAVFLALSFAEVFNYILRRGPITADKLHGALAGYIMIAVFWAFVYAVVERVSPGSFGPNRIDLGQPGALFVLIYFSLTTLTTTGFGDIAPMTNQARSFVMIEEFTGLFFVGVVIARLAGLYPASPKEPP